MSVKHHRVLGATAIPSPETPYPVTIHVNYDLRKLLESAAVEMGRPGIANGVIAIVKSWVEYVEEMHEREEIAAHTPPILKKKKRKPVADEDDDDQDGEAA